MEDKENRTLSLTIYMKQEVFKNNSILRFSDIGDIGKDSGNGILNVYSKNMIKILSINLRFVQSYTIIDTYKA